MEIAPLRNTIIKQDTMIYDLKEEAEEKAAKPRDLEICNVQIGNVFTT